MADQEFTFEVTVIVSDWPATVPVYADETGGPRTARDYAEAALNAAGLREAHYLDGFADLESWADGGPHAHIEGNVTEV